MKKKLKILTSIWFLIGLVLLLLNDFFLKDWYGNWFTGKLSDFAGLFIFPLFWSSMFPKYRKAVFILTGLGFIYWKSPYSSFLIESWNNLGLWNITRVVDFTDLMALFVLPFSYYLINTQQKQVKLHITPYPIAVITIFAFMATSKHEPDGIIEKFCFKEFPINYYINYTAKDSLVKDLKNIEYDVKFSKFGVVDVKIDSRYESIFHFTIILEDYDPIRKSVKVSLGCCEYFGKTPIESIQKRRDISKKDFEMLVLAKLPSRKTWIVQDNYVK